MESGSGREAGVVVGAVRKGGEGEGEWVSIDTSSWVSVDTSSWVSIDTSSWVSVDTSVGVDTTSVGDPRGLICEGASRSRGYFVDLLHLV
jgi:hypothetical protein